MLYIWQCPSDFVRIYTYPTTSKTCVSACSGNRGKLTLHSSNPKVCCQQSTQIEDRDPFEKRPVPRHTEAPVISKLLEFRARVDDASAFASLAAVAHMNPHSLLVERWPLRGPHLHPHGNQWFGVQRWVSTQEAAGGPQFKGQVSIPQVRPYIQGIPVYFIW